MRFGSLPLPEAEGAILAHSLRAGGRTLKKGRILSADDIRDLERAGHAEVMVARLEPGDAGEDEAAVLVAKAIAGSGVRIAAPFTGRSNLFAESAGVAVIDRERLIALNSIDEGLTVATVAPFERVAFGQMVATVKVIPFALPGAIIAEAGRIAAGAVSGLVRLSAFRPRQAGLVVTMLAGAKRSLLDKRVEAIRGRIEAAGSSLAWVETARHAASDVERAVRDLANRGADPILVFGASAIVDRGDVIPTAVVAAGGVVDHLGMPVDPGNLLMLGRLGPARVIGVPSCASSPRINGFDWVLERTLAGLEVTGTDIIAMAPGGLLMEIATRPQPRAGAPPEPAHAQPRIAALILAAGRSTRMGPRNKLLEPLGGEPIVRHVARAAQASAARPVVVVTGHQAEAVSAALAGLDVRIAHNPRFAEGLSTSLAAGLDALPKDIDGALVLLGDMPRIEAQHLDRLIASFAPKAGRTICVPVQDGRRGNPVLWGAACFQAMRSVRGDTGARHLIGEHAEQVCDVELGTDAIFADVDTPEALAQLRDTAQ